jgi:hypothetical protein
MLLVREGDRLRRSIADARILRRRVIVQSRDAETGRKHYANGRSPNPEVSQRGKDKGQSSLLALVSDADHVAIIAPTHAEEFAEPRRIFRIPILRKRHYRKFTATEPNRHRFPEEQSVTENPTAAIIRNVRQRGQPSAGMIRAN